MKRIMRVVLSAMMVFSVISVNVRAEEENVELSQLTTDDGLFEYEISNGEVTITSFDETYSGAIEIPDQIDGDRVTAIASYAFYGCSITGVTIPSTVTEMGYYVFAGCENLTNVTIENGVTEINDYAFSSCTRLESIKIPNSVTIISQGAFSYCEKLKNVTISDHVTSIGEYAFRECKSLEKLTIPDSVKKLGERAFYYCSNLTSIEIPKSVIYIGRNTFNHCDKLTIYGEKGSYAETVANDLEIPFEVIPCKAHVIDEIVTKAEPTCQTTGLKLYICSVCGWTGSRVIRVTGHNEVSIPAVSATCQKTGLSEGKKCMWCETVTVPQKTVAKKAHSYNIYDKCTMCSAYATYINASVPKMTVKSISKAKGALTVKWKKNTKVKGYQVRYSLKSNMSSAKTVKITKNKTTSKKIKSLKKKTTYYVQIRAYQTIGGKTMYSPWSAVKSAKTK